MCVCVSGLVAPPRWQVLVCAHAQASVASMPVSTCMAVKKWTGLALVCPLLRNVNVGARVCAGMLRVNRTLTHLNLDGNQVRRIDC